MKNVLFIVVFVQIFIAIPHSKPMESLTNYNVILVHGAASSGDGLDCSKTISDAYQYIEDARGDYSARMDGALGTMRELRPWLEIAVLKDTSIINASTIYQQRPFINPAHTPAHNAKEIGNRNWKGENGCSTRRSLIEEAQEVRAKGKVKLKDYRTNPKYHYEDSLLPPSRNILIAHSMGGVASREYVQGNFYNEDVDKVITLDSPHEGTQALSLVLNKHEDRLIVPAVMTTGQLFAWATALSAMSFDYFSNLASTGIAIIAGANLVQVAGSNLLDVALQVLFPYTKEDPLVPYIDPDSWRYGRKGVETIEDLRTREYDFRQQTPMFRLLYSTKSLTFTNPQHSKSQFFSRMVFPDALLTAAQNVYAQSVNDNPADFKVNAAFASMYMGALFGLGLEDNGSSLIPSWSGSAKNTPFLNNPNVDVKKIPYNGAFISEETTAFTLLSAAAVTSMVADAALSWAPSLRVPAKIGIIAATTAMALPFINATVMPFIMDFDESHRAPVTSTHQFTWFGTPNTYPKIIGGDVTITPYLMEEFLYEKPFVNLRVKSAYSENWEVGDLDSLGLYVKDAEDSTKLVPIYIADNLSSPLKFNSPTDWEALGAKKERWTKTLGTGGDSIPIRHADRYQLPAVMAKNFIEKYEFEIDDLMPHRLRQIRINFNFNEDIAWECDINKPENASDACLIYKRTPASPEWIPVGEGRHPHPVQKNGVFIFEPRNYYQQLGIIQKDNQNTVTITTVNKIGLKNSQRFYYMFKATADLLEPIWPVRNIKVSNLDSFRVYVSALDYQDIDALGGGEFLEQDLLEDPKRTDSVEMSRPVLAEHGNGHILKSKGDYTKFQDKEGKYRWRLAIETGDFSDPTKSSVSEMTIPFTLDITPPKTALVLERDVMNLDSMVFLARFENDAKVDDALRLAAFFLKNSAGKTIGTAKFTEIIAANFGVKLSDFKDANNAEITDLPDGKYKIASYAFDGSTGSLEQYNLLNEVVGSRSSLYELFENNQVKQGVIAHRNEADFISDMQPPEFSFTLSGDILNQDNLLKIILDVSDSNGKDTATIRYIVSFANTSLKKDTLRLGDTMLLLNGNGSKEWKELESMAIPDGDYEIIIDVWDEPGNHRRKKYNKLLRIDRTPPAIVEVWSRELVYKDSLSNYSAIMEVKQPGIESHLQEMQCRYRINGSEWQNITAKLQGKAGKQTLDFNISSDIAGKEHGKRYLEAGCADWAGNFASKLDLFNVGARFPDITYPKDDIARETVIAIRGFAPVQSSSNLPGSYQLEWRKEGDSAWQTKGIDVGAGKRYSADSAWISKNTYSSEADLGFLDMDELENGNYELRISVRDCDDCQWRRDSVYFYYSPEDSAGNKTAKAKLFFSASDRSFIPDEGFLFLSLQLTGTAGEKYRTRIYARDSEGNALFEASADSLTASPYAGKPDSFEGDGVWFWSEDDVYHLRWNGLPESEEIAIHYTEGKFDESMCGNECAFKDTALVSNKEMLSHVSQNILNEMIIPANLNKAMIFSEASGVLSFKNDDIFWIKLKKNMDATHKVYLGKGGSPQEYIVKYSGTGIQINKNLYGLYYKWDGISSTGRYPQGQTVDFYAEALENLIGGKVLRDSINVMIKKPALRIISDSIPLDNFYVIKNSVDSGSVLGSKTISYGIVGRDAMVSAYVKKSDGSIVKKLFENVPHTTSRSAIANSISWNGENQNGHLVLDSGSYYFEIIATEKGAFDNPQPYILKRDFRISLASGINYVKDTPGESTTSSLSLLHANSISPSYWQYAPVADYLVQADASGKWLPDSLRKIDVEWAASGTQNVYGYPPQRFSLAIKRQREILPLIIVAKPMLKIIDQPCHLENDFNRFVLDSSYTRRVEFNKDKLSDTLDLRFEANNYTQNGSGLDHTQSRGENKIYLYAFLLKDANNKNSDAIKNMIGDKLFVWSDTINLPETTSGGGTAPIYNSLRPKDNTCSYEEPGNGSEGKFCIYELNHTGRKKTTDNYDPNKNLFQTTVMPVGSYYSAWGEIHNSCGKQDDTRYQTFHVKIKLAIPNSYWNEGYGYDNLVNRTIRLDQTNATMYGGDGYLKALHDSLDIGNIFYDGTSWHPNYTYGRLTPFEMHRFPFVSVSDLASNNAFAFPDETGTYKSRSYYHAKFYNNEHKYKAEIKGQYCNGRTMPQFVSPAYCSEYADDSTSLHPDMDSVKTEHPLAHGKVDIYVSMNADQESFHKDTARIAYPADTNWIDLLKDRGIMCKDFTDDSWPKIMESEASCRKFYKNYSNVYYKAIDNCEKSFSAISSNYDSHNNRFYLKTNCAPYIEGVNATYTPKILNIADSLYAGSTQDTLYINAPDWDSSFVWLQKNYPTRESSIPMQIGNLFKNEWVKKLRLAKASANHLDSSEHTHFQAALETDSIIKLTMKDAISVIRPSEFVAVKGMVPESANWKLSYLNNGSLHAIAQKRTNSVFEWFDVNRLQGNTSILLQWGNEGSLLNIRKLDLDIGSRIKPDSGGTVQSLFGEVSVWFPPNAIDTVITVRTVDAKEYAFTTSNGSALVGPVIEVLPSTEFPETLERFPRVKARITQQDLQRMNLSPDNVRLYKVDTDSKKFIELENTLRGFDTEPNCSDSLIYTNCPNYKASWSYLLVSAETRTFSLFAVLDTAVARLLNEEPEKKPDTIPSQIICSIIPQDTLWLGLDNGYLEMFQECNQLIMGTLQIRKDGNIITERSQISAEAMRWDGNIGLNKISDGEYSSRYIAISSLGSETQTLGPTVLTDSARPQISDWDIEEHSELLSRAFVVNAKVKDGESGIKSVTLKWNLGGIADSVPLVADSSGFVSHKIVLDKNRLSQCLGCQLKLSLIAEDFGHNHAKKEWASGNLYPYPADLALWYPALEGSGKTAHEYTNTGHDLDLLMQTPWLSASGIYFEKSEDRASGKGQVNFGSTDSYTLEAWIRPGHTANSIWQRVLGFNSTMGKRIELQVNGKNVRLLDGSEAWTVLGLLQQPKAWTHLIVAVNADYAHFYVDGKLAGTVVATPSERLWYGKFSLGMEKSVPSFAGHIMQVRFYKRALEAEEVLALFRGMGENSYAEITLAGELNWKTDGVERGFSCAVPGSSYWETSKESSLSWKAWVEQAASYRIFVYARSAQPGSKAVKAGVSGALVSGTVSLESVWRSVPLQEIALPLKAGFNDIELRFPAGMDIAGIAVSDNPSLLPSQISWKSENSTAGTSSVIAQVRFEGHPDPSMIRPRIRLQNIGSATIYGPKVRYYFRGEDPAEVHASKYYPQEGNIVVRQEGNNLGYAEWSFPETTALPAGQLLFWGEGPHFGLHNTNYVPWVIEDDMSEIIVLDSENRVLSGSCFENEHPLNTTPTVQVLARDSRAGDNQASQLYIKLENIGQVPIRDYEVRYSFYVQGNITPVLDVYDMQGLSASLVNLGSGRWQVAISGSASLGPGISWANPAQFALRLPNWQTGWNAGDDPSYEGLSAEWKLAKGIEVFDASGNRIYGKEPAWPIEPIELASSSSSQIRVMAKQTKAYESNASAVRFYVENLGTESISGFEVRYWFSVAQGKQFGYQVHNNTQFHANVVNDGGNLYSGRFVYTGSQLASGAKTEWGNGLEFFIHHSDWSAWNKENDFSNKDLGTDFSEAHYMAIYDSNGNLIWGTEPIIPGQVDSPAIGVARLPNGLLVTLLESSQLRLDLVNAAGMPQKFIYQGTLGAGEHMIPVDWSNVDIARTYLVVRLNGKITTQLLSTLGN